MTDAPRTRDIQRHIAGLAVDLEAAVDDYLEEHCPGATPEDLGDIVYGAIAFHIAILARHQDDPLAEILESITADVRTFAESEEIAMAVADGKAGRA